jgi:diacylglycerol kinase (ATP)
MTPAPAVHLVGNRSLDDVLDAMRRLGVTAEVIRPAALTTSATIDAIRAAIVDGGATRVIVVGGDGIVHAGVNAMAPLVVSHRVSLGVVAVGTGNDFARALQLPTQSLDEALRVALGDAQPIDLLRCEHGYTATVAICGFPARVNERANRMRWPKGPNRYSLATMLQLPHLRADDVSLRFDDGEPQLVTTTIVAVGNTGWFGGGMHIVPPARPDDGVLDMLLAGRLGRLSLLRYLPSVFSGTHLSHGATSLHRAKRVHIDGPADMDIWGDGEPLGSLPVTIEVVPNALPVAYVARATSNDRNGA